MAVDSSQTEKTENSRIKRESRKQQKNVFSISVVDIFGARYRWSLFVVRIR